MNKQLILTWDHWHAILMLVLTALCLFHFPIGLILAGTAISFLIYTLLGMIHFPAINEFSSPANWITLFRLGILLTSVFYYPLIAAPIFLFLILLVIVLDGVDGFVARKLKKESEFGAFFDMEVDAALACILSILLFRELGYGFWILIAGVMRYLFVTVKFILNVEKIQVKRSLPGTKTIAVFYFSTLIGAFIIPYKLALPFLMISNLLILFSFGKELFIILQLKKRREGELPDADKRT